MMWGSGWELGVPVAWVELELSELGFRGLPLMSTGRTFPDFEILTNFWRHKCHNTKKTLKISKF